MSSGCCWASGRLETTGRMLSVVAGGRYARVCVPVPIILPVTGKTRLPATSG